MLRGDVSIDDQIRRQVRELIADGAVGKGEELPSLRQLAVDRADRHLGAIPSGMEAVWPRSTPRWVHHESRIVWPPRLTIVREGRPPIRSDMSRMRAEI
jgi:hypothetical protein